MNPAVSTRRWRPRFATREVEFPQEHGTTDHDHDHEGEWKVQLVASVFASRSRGLGFCLRQRS
jgi:hypothetical protein